ncbi:MAG: guanylate kinase [Christensenellales bacterium]|jgi:guanylate kinase
MENHKGLLLVVSGPSGVGKGTICKAVINRNPGVKLSVSATTRAKRQGEEEGKSYFFKTKEEFERMIRDGELLEHVLLYNSNYYGTPRANIEAEIEACNDIILEIDYHGALAVKETFPDAVLIFIAPPVMEELKARLEHRASESEDSKKIRLKTALEEMRMIGEYDYVVVNDNIEKAVTTIEAIVTAEKSRVSRNAELVKKLMEDWT